MVTSLRKGTYRLIETKEQTKVLTLDEKVYSWVVDDEFPKIGIMTHNPRNTDHLLATGKYRLHQILDDPELSELQHLKLNVGEKLWQGYVLLNGLPNDKKKSSRIIPTKTILSAQ